MGTFKLIVSKDKEYAMAELDEMYIDDDRMILDTVRNLASKIRISSCNWCASGRTDCPRQGHS